MNTTQRIELLISLHPRALRYATKLTNDRDLADDLVQETFRRILMSKSATLLIDKEEVLRGYFFRALRNTHAEQCRARDIRNRILNERVEMCRQASQGRLDFEDQLIARLMAETVVELIVGKIYRDDWPLFLRHVVGQETVGDLALQSGRTYPALKSSFYHISKQLRAQLA